MIRWLCGLTVALVLASALCRGQEPQGTSGSLPSHPGSARAFGQKRKIKGLPNFGEVTPTLSRSAAHPARLRGPIEDGHRDRGGHARRTERQRGERSTRARNEICGDSVALSVSA